MAFFAPTKTHNLRPNLSKFLFPNCWRTQKMELFDVSVAGLLPLLLFFLYALFRILPIHRKRLPPEAGGAWPLIGHLHLLTGKEPAHKTLARMADEYGPIFTLRFGMHKALVVSSWEIAKECFTTNDRIFASRPKLVAPKLLGYGYAMFGTSPYGPYWTHVRKIATFELHRLGKLQPIVTSEIHSSIKKLYEICVNGRRSGGDEKVSVEMKTWFGDVTINTILRMVIGKRSSMAFDGSANERYRKALTDFLKLFGMFVPSDSFPFLSWLDLGGHEKAMKKTAKVLDEVLDKWLREHREKRSFGEVEMEEHNFLDVVLSTIKDDKELSGYDVDTVIKATCLALILGGFDTTSTAMTWVLCLLVNNQEALKKVQLELDEHVGRDRQVEESDVKNLIYFQASVKETLRFYPAAPLSVIHESTEDCTVAGYHVPAGTRLIVNVQKLQRDPSFWENPCEFRPERFLTTHKKFDVKGQSPQLIPFGAGRRVCPAISFSMQVLHLTIANLLHGFKIDRPSEELLDMEESAGLNSAKKVPLEVVLTPRLSAQVYE